MRLRLAKIRKEWIRCLDAEDAKRAMAACPRTSPRSVSKTRVPAVCIRCGSKRVRRERVSVELRDGRTIANVEAEVCADCGERYCDLETMRRIEVAAGAPH